MNWKLLEYWMAACYIACTMRQNLMAYYIMNTHHYLFPLTAILHIYIRHGFKLHAYAD